MRRPGEWTWEIRSKRVGACLSAKQGGTAEAFQAFVPAVAYAGTGAFFFCRQGAFQKNAELPKRQEEKK
ncbi:hypothetical protein AGMMS49983_17420 [Clostridia bacterium]|nr:hypothetical protein AGMMS49983_17420 [Clostridia bacterium]